MSKKAKKINISEKQVKLIRTEEDEIIVESLNDEELKIDKPLTDVLKEISSEGKVINIRISEYKEPKPKKEAEPKIKYSCNCGNEFNSKKSGLSIHCNSCDSDFEETQE